MAVIGATLSWLIWLYTIVLTARAVLSIVPMLVPDWRPKGFVLLLAETVYTLTDPPLRFIGRWVRPLRVGDVALDMGFLVLWIVLIILQRLVSAFFF